MMRFLFCSAAALALAGCGLLAEVGVLDDSSKGSFIRGDAYAAFCKEVGGTWSWKGGTLPRCTVDY